MEIKDIKTYTNKLEPKDLAMIHHCLDKEWSRLSTFQENIERSFKPYELPTKTFNKNVHNRTSLLITEIQQELQYLENLLNYTREFFNYPETPEYHCYISEPETGTNHINNTL